MEIFFKGKSLTRGSGVESPQGADETRELLNYLNLWPSLDGSRPVSVCVCVWNEVAWLVH